MSNHNCPNCHSTNVLVGAFVLSCGDCDWHYLNKYPCTVCGKPSYSAYGCKHPAKGIDVKLHGCKEHPVTRQLGYTLGNPIPAVPPPKKPFDSAAGIEAVPIEFSDEIVNAPVLHAPLIPLVYYAKDSTS